MTQIRNVLQKWHSRKYSIFTHFPKDRNCEVCLRTKTTRKPCRRGTGEAVPRAEKFGDLIAADHKVLNEGGESRNNHRYSVVVQDLADQWIQSHPCKTKNIQETEKSSRKFLEFCQKCRKSFTRTVLWNFGKSCEEKYGIIELRHLLDPTRMVLLKEQYAELRKGRLQYCCNQAWTNNGGLIPWSVTAACEMFKTSCLMGRHLANGDLENQSETSNSVWGNG